MKFSTILVLFITFSASLYCQTETPEISSPLEKDVYVSGGISFPYLPSEFKNYYDNGINGNLGFGFSFDPGDFGYSSVYGTASFNRFNFNETSYRNAIKKQSVDTIISGGSVNVFTFTLNYKGSFSSTKKSIAPYFVIGIGYMYLAADSVKINNRPMFSIEGEPLSTFTWSFGIGFEVPVTDRFTAYAQGESVIGVFDRTRQYFPVSIGLRVKM